MRVIKKGKEPKSLTEYKKKKYAYYDGCRKEPIKEALLKEQGYLCAYCMCRISKDAMKIEHYEAQRPKVKEEKENKHKEKQERKKREKQALNYNNMLGVCMGNKDTGDERKFTCDAHRGNKELVVNPFSNYSIDLIEYDNDGRIYSNNLEINKDLNETLNLNCEEVLLKLNRKKTLEALRNHIYKLKKNGSWNKKNLESIKGKFEFPDKDGKLSPYSGVILYYLNKRIGK